jgi:hypothetical protein
MNIYEYMTARAASEGKRHTLPRALYEAWFDLGIRTFFGVRVNASGTLIEDQQNPEFFKAWKGTERGCAAN